jgi:hypothetical protein
MRFVILVAIFATLVSFTGPARATLFCVIPQTPDGFVALRAAPDANARLVASMRPGDEVQLLDGKQGRWLEVRHWHGEDRLQEPTRNLFRRGWAHARYLGDCG